MTDAPQQKPNHPIKGKHMSPRLRFALEMGPLLLFFLAFKYADIMLATGILIATTLLSLGIIYAIERKLAPMLMITGAMVTIFGGMTIFLNDTTFMQIKPTIINLLFASILLGGLVLKKPMLKYVLNYALQLEERGWWLLSLRWGIFFLFLAALNEYIWRSYPLDFWVKFKVFGVFACTLVFTFCQIPLIQRYMVEEKKS